MRIPNPKTWWRFRHKRNTIPKFDQTSYQQGWDDGYESGYNTPRLCLRKNGVNAYGDEILCTALLNHKGGHSYKPVPDLTAEQLNMYRESERMNAAARR